MKVVFFNLKSFKIKQKIKKALKHALKILNISGYKVSVNFGYVSESAIQKLNAQHRGQNKITDVLSFPLLSLEPGIFITQKMYEQEKHPKTDVLELGDIVVCEAVAEKQAKQLGHSYLREVVFLATHGFLHILGFDHKTEQEEEEMNKLCQKVLTDIGVKR